MSFVRNTLAALVGFGAGAVLLYAVVPQRIAPTTKAEQETLAARESCQVLFVGPSYVDSQVKPPLFDAEAERIGLRARSCKYGRAGLKGFELRRDLQRLFRHEWPALELVVVDITLGQGIAFQNENWFKPRMLEWHTWDALPWLLGFYQRDPRSWTAKGPEAFSHLEHVAGNYLQLGRGPELLAELQLVRRLSQPDDAAVKPAPGEKEKPRVKRKRKRSRKAVPISHAHYERKLKRLKERKTRLRESGALAPSEWPLELRDMIRAYGFEAYFLHAPVWRLTRMPKRAVRGDDLLVVLDFNDPFRFPELYREEMRGKTHHLSSKGNKVYSRLLAQELHKRWRPQR
jgi:hypothetical protein